MRKAIVVSCLAAMTLCLAGCRDKVQASAGTQPAATAQERVIANPGDKPGCTSCPASKDKAAKPGA